MAAQPVNDGRRMNVKLILLGGLVVILVLFALLNTRDVDVDFILSTWSAPMILVIVIAAAIGFALAVLVRGNRTNRRRS